MLKTFQEGQLVRVAADGGEYDGIVVHTAGIVKIEVAVETGQGPMFLTVHPKAVTAREDAVETDEALRRVIRRGAVAGRAESGSGRGRRAHTRVASHRTTGK